MNGRVRRRQRGGPQALTKHNHVRSALQDERVDVRRVDRSQPSASEVGE